MKNSMSNQVRSFFIKLKTNSKFYALLGVKFIIPTLITILFTAISPYTLLNQDLQLWGSFMFIITFTIFLGIRVGVFITIITSLSFYSHQIGQYQPHHAYFILMTSFIFYILKLLKRNISQSTYQTNHHFRLLADKSLHPIILKDRKGKIFYASSTISDILGIKQKKLIDKRLEDFIHPDDLNKYKNFFKKLVKTPQKKQTIEFRLKGKGKEWLWLQNDTINLLHDPEISAIIGNFQDISKQKQLDEQKQGIIQREKTARTIAEKAVRTRDEFLSVASHELKTPLTTILLQLQGTLRSILTQSLADFSGEKLVNSLNIAEQQSQRLSLMIKDLLNVSLVSTGRIEIKKQELDLSQLVKKVLKDYKEQSDKNGYKIATNLKPDIIGNWDPIRIEQILVNLLSNAVKYGNKKPIHITTGTKDKIAFVSIKDRGIGIKKQDQKKLFELFERGSNNKKKGLGVGLFISKKIALSHQGDISVSSQPKKGSTFTLILPLENK